MEGALINVDKTNQITSDQNVKSKFKLPFSAASIVGSTDANLIDFMLTAYGTIREDSRIQVSKIMPRLKEEIKAKKLGVASQLFIKALNSSLMTAKGIGLPDNEFKEDIEEDITQTLYDFIMNAKKALGESKSLYLGLDGKRIFEAESDKIRGLDTDAFLAVANTIVPETGDIKVPDGGFKEGMTANTDFAKFQLLLYKYFKKSLGTWQVYINFAAKKTGDGNGGTPTGNYGKTTSALVSTIKTYLEKPRWEDSNGAQIDAAFVKRIQDEIKKGSITESSSIRYLGLDGNTIINEDFGAPASDPAAKPVVKSTAKSQVKTQTKASTTNVGGLVGPLKTNAIAKDIPNSAWRYRVIGGRWNSILTSDKTDTLGLVRSPKWIAALIAEFPNQGGHYLRMKKQGDTWSGIDPSASVIGYTRKDNKWYLVPVSGSPTEVGAGSQAAIDLDNLYVKTGYVSGTSTSGIATAAQIDTDVVKLGNEIKQFVENGANFKAYANLGFWGDDDESGAWKNVLLPRWTTVWKPKVASIRSRVNASSLITATDKSRYETSLQTIEGMFRDPERNPKDRDFFFKFFGSTANDVYELPLLLSVAGKNSDKITIDTDFEYDE
jgi:hypothetical protein